MHLLAKHQLIKLFTGITKMNEYVIYWREAVLYRSKIIASSEEEARKAFINLKENNEFEDDIDFENDNFEFEIDNIECIEEGVE